MTTLKTACRSRINSALSAAGLNGNRRFEKVGGALSVAVEHMRAGGLELGETVSLLETDQGRCSVRLALSNAADPFSPEEISNSMLVLQWTRLETGFEVVGYLS